MSNVISQDRIVHYPCRKAPGAFPINGDLEKLPWRGAERSRPFVDLVTGEQVFLKTQMAALWDEKALYVACWNEEPDVRASLTERDSLIWYDNDVEVFFGGEDCYYEFEINAFNTVYEVFFIYQDALKRGSRFDTPQFDLYTKDVDVLSGFQDPVRYKKHPRGRRWAFMDFDFPGLQSAVKVDGKINDPSHIDRGWTVEIAFPWEGFRILNPGKTFPPAGGDSIRGQFFRFENIQCNGRPPFSAGWSLNEHGVYDSHIPENFAYLHFTD
ncbi:MAG: carbohydrate-binding family 9-like protein [Spirochaetaceae bacterium]|jgi:hypothetical protein|nr:carbohydrate-binding family 9-like protein [Spirochaetaceae bacterium]